MPKKYSIKENVFNVLTSESCYWIGYLAADGCISDNNRISLKSKDKEQLEKFKKFLDFTGPIKRIESKLGKSIRHNGKRDIYICWQIRFCSDIIKSSLNLHGIVNNKSLTLDFSSEIPDIFIHDYIRGYIDGDGCWSVSNNQKGCPTVSLTILSSKHFLEKIKYIFYDKELIYDKEKGYLYKPSKIYGLQYSGNKQIRRIADWLDYGKEPFLNRKKQFLIDNNIINENGKMIEIIIDHYGNKNPNSKIYEITDPNGRVYIVDGGLKKFCNQYGLNYAKMLDVRFKRKRSEKGWKCSLKI